MKDVVLRLRRGSLALWHVAVFITGIALMVIWLAAWWLERAIGQALPRIVAVLPEKYHPLLLTLAAFTAKLSGKDWR